MSADLWNKAQDRARIAAADERADDDDRYRRGPAPGKRSMVATAYRDAAGGGAPGAGAAGALERAATTGGTLLPAELRAMLERALGVDLGGVRVHDGPESAEAAGAIRAHAYTVGQDIHFGRGAYSPDSPGGRRLIAHEVAHAAQNGPGDAPTAPAASGQLSISQPGDAAELEAERFADDFAAGRAAPSPSRSPGGVARAVIHREANQSLPEPDASEVAEEKDRLRALDLITEAENASEDAVMRVMKWEIQELKSYSKETMSSPGEVFEPGMVRGALGIGVSFAVSTGAGAISAAAGKLGLPGFLVGLAVDALGGLAADKLKEVVQGGKEKTAHEGGEVRADLLTGAHAAQIDQAFETGDGSIKHVRGACSRAREKAGKGVSKADVDALIEWANSQKSKSSGIKPTAGSLLQPMLRLSIIKNAASGTKANEGVDQERWQRACKRIFGEERIPYELFALLQLEAEWTAMGLPTHEVKNLSKKTGFNPITFSSAADPNLFGYKVSGGETSSRRYRYLAAGGAFTLSCQYAIWDSANDGTELSGTSYTLDLQSNVDSDSGASWSGTQFPTPPPATVGGLPREEKPYSDMTGGQSTQPDESGACQAEPDPKLPDGGAPPDDSKHKKLDAADPKSRDRVRARISAMENASEDAVRRVMRWQMQELKQFVRVTGTGPGSMYSQGTADWMAGKAMAKGAGAAGDKAAESAGKAIGKKLPLMGGIASNVIKLLSGELASKLAEFGTPDSKAGAEAAAETLEDGFEANIDAAFQGGEEHMKLIRGWCAQGTGMLVDGMTQERLQELDEWAGSESKRSSDMNPAPGAMWRGMVEMWVIRNSIAPNAASPGVNQDRWKAACKEVFGSEEIPRTEYPVLQLLTYWASLGLPTDQHKLLPTGGSGMAWFTYAVDPAKFALAMSGGDKEKPRYKHLASGGAFRLLCHYHMGPGDAIVASDQNVLRSTVLTLDLMGLVEGDGGETMGDDDRFEGPHFDWQGKTYNSDAGDQAVCEPPPGKPVQRKEDSLLGIDLDSVR